MPLPLAPIAGFALRYGTVALATYTFARSIEPGRRDQRHEDALNDVDEGITFRRGADQANVTHRWKRVIRLKSGGPGLEIDATTLSRIRFRKV
ncbi:MAG: hypothetical protein ACRBCL_14135 [Maritimibacter sp.]